MLRNKSENYNSCREASLGECAVFYLHAETQAAYREIRVMRNHLTPDQMKPVRYMDNPVKRKFFEIFTF